MAATVKFIERGPEDYMNLCLGDGKEFTEAL
jgi:hypothetical protein